MESGHQQTIQGRERTPSIDEAFYQQVVQADRNVVFGLTREGRWLFLSRASGDVYGYAPAEMIGAGFTDSSLEDCLAADKQFLIELARDGTRDCYETRHRRRDGTSVDLRLRASALRDAFGGVTGYAGTLEDITEEKREAARRITAEHQLRHSQKLEAVGQLAAGIAHEINTPIQYIGDNTRFVKNAFRTFDGLLDLYGQLLAAVKAGPVSPELIAQIDAALKKANLTFLKAEVPAAVDQTLIGVERVAKIVRAMREFSHPGRGEMAPTDLHRLIESTAVVCQNTWKYTADLVTDFDRELPLVPCHGNEVNQVLLNLIVNATHAIRDAIKVHPTPSGKGTITISTRRETDWAVIRVSDTGTGIPAAVRDRIFEPFFTTKAVGEGTGQGLIITQSVMKRHGGSIEFESTEGRGTTFILRLPLSSAKKGQNGDPQTAIAA